MKTKKIFYLLPLIVLSGCATNMIPNDYKVDTPIKFNEKFNFQSSEISQKEKIKKMESWWEQFNNPFLLELIKNAQNNNPSIASSIVNLKNYEKLLVSNNARNTPTISSSLSSLHSGTNVSSNTVSQLGFQTSWELDLLGFNALNIKANELQLDGAKAQWHEARTLVAAEVARSYFNYHFCATNVKILERDYDSIIKQNYITDLNVKAGFESKSSLFLSNAGLAQAKNNLTSGQAQCNIEIKSLVALTDISEDDLITGLNKDKSNIQEISEGNNLGFFLPISIPGELITQRPDVFSSQQNLQAAVLKLATARGESFPKISISGNISTNISSSNLGTSWNIGPLSITLPIFDGGIIKANEAIYNAQYEQAKIEFSSKIRIAIKEVEIALINLNSTEEKNKLNKTSVDGYQKFYKSILAKYEAGLSSLFELEDSRRTYLNSLSFQLSSQKERFNAWIDLYKALGGGFINNGEIK